MVGDRTVAESLAEITAELVAQEPSAATRAAVARTLIDWFGVTVAGSAEPLPRTLAATLASGGSARLLGSTRGDHRADPSTAALINGTAAHVLELDDIYAPGLVHPSAPVIAAAMAVGDLLDTPGAVLERAVIAGVEVAGRVAEDLGPSHYRRWHTTGTAGALGAAAAAAYLLELDGTATTHALALAATMAGGLQQTFRRDAAGKPLHSGNAAQAGVVAAISASGGATGATDALEGEAGLAAATGSEATWAACRERSPRTPVIEQLTVKPYPCCGHTFAAVGAAIDLHARGVRPDDVEAITVATYGTAIDVAGNPDPQTVAGARFSLAYTVAVALTDGRLDQACFTPERISDPVRQALSARVALTAAPQYDAGFPARRGAAVTVRLRSGDEVSQALADRPGSPQNPLSADAIGAKFTGLAEPVLGGAAAAALREQLLDVSSVGSVRDLG